MFKTNLKTKRVPASIIADKGLAALVKEAASAEVGGSIWKPKVEGDAIAGEVVTLRDETGKYGRQTVLSVLTDSGAYTVYANASLERGLVQGKVKTGSKIAVVFKGRVKTGRGRPFAIYSVAVGK